VTEPNRPKLKPAVQAVELTKIYSDFEALAPFELTVEKGESLAIVGHNGSGKSTLLRILAGLLEPSAGDALIYGHAAGSLRARRSVTFIPDNPVLYDDLSVREHVEYISRLHGGPGCDDDAQALVEAMGLTSRIDDLPTTFSRGLRQRASIIVALARPFDILLVDEPFVGLDATGKEALLTQFRSATERGSTVLVATHEEHYVERVSRCVALRDGVMVHDGDATPADVLALVS
jgi:ABC-2 type transport system ATP-binding protein